MGLATQATEPTAIRALCESLIRAATLRNPAYRAKSAHMGGKQAVVGSKTTQKSCKSRGQQSGAPKKRMSVQVFVPEFEPKTGTLCLIFSRETDAISLQKCAFAGGKEWS